MFQNPQRGVFFRRKKRTAPRTVFDSPLGEHHKRPVLTLNPSKLKTPKKASPFAGITVMHRRIAFEAATAVFEVELSDDHPCPDIGTTRESIIYLDGKIGADSIAAQIFKLGFRDYPDVFVALKVMPHISHRTHSMNEQEIEVSVAASNLVKEGKSSFFPLVYGRGSCPDIALTPPEFGERDPNPGKNPQSVVLYDRVNNWKVVRNLIDRYTRPEDFNAYAELFLLADPFSVAAHLRRNYVPRGSILKEILADPVLADLTSRAQGEFLVLELAWGEMGKYLEEDPANLKHLSHMLIATVLQGIIDMQTHLNLVHGDLHLGNVLIQLIALSDDETDVEPWPLINDFGVAEQIDWGSPASQLKDVQKFMSALGHFTRSLPRSVRDKVSRFNRLMLSRTPPFSNMQDVFQWWTGEFLGVEEKIDEGLSRYLA